MKKRFWVALGGLALALAVLAGPSLASSDCCQTGQECCATSQACCQ